MNVNRKLVSEFLDEIRERAELNFKGRMHQAFLAWYIEAEFGEAKWNFTDDPHDSGVDAIVWHPDDLPGVTLIQSKFTENVSKGKLSRKTYKEFKDVVKAFRYGDERFEELVSKARTDLRPLYRKAHEALEKADNWFQRKKAFRLVTTKRGRTSFEFGTIPPENFLYAGNILRLYSDYRQAQTPKARDLTLQISDKLPYALGPRGVTSYLLNARMSDFRTYLESYDVARLLARNIRYDLGSQIGKEIRGTYEASPGDFWFCHNGLTIVCDDFIERNKVATLVAPSVVNGGQTLYAISASSNKRSSALVPVKVIVRSEAESKAVEDDTWLQKVIRSVNSQNRVRESDLHSNEPEQVLLQNKFRTFKVYYERKRGEWRVIRNEPRYRKYERLSMIKLGQILTAVGNKNGDGVLSVKKGLDNVFGDAHYRKIFPNRATVARRFDQIYLAYRISLLLEEHGYKDRSERRKLRHAFWNTLWIFYRGIAPSLRLGRLTSDSIRRAFDEFGNRPGLKRMAKRATRDTVTNVWRTWRKARKSDPELWTPNNFFKSQYGIKAIRRTAAPKVHEALERMGRAINTYK
ncbi:MAG: AIPR family protein [Candidatus Acidiferrales bacterium]